PEEEDQIRADRLLPALPEGGSLRAPRRLLDALTLPYWARGVGERLPDGLEHEPQDDPGQDADPAPRRHDQGQRSLADRSSACTTRRDGPARGQMRRRRRARRPDRRGACDGLPADLQSESRRVELQRDRPRRRTLL